MRKIFALVLVLAVVAFASSWALVNYPGADPVGGVATGISVEAAIPVPGVLEISPIGEYGSMAIAEIETGRQTTWRNGVTRLFGFERPIAASIFWTGAAFLSLVLILRSRSRARNKTDLVNDDAGQSSFTDNRLTSADRFPNRTVRGDGGVQLAGDPA